MALLTKLTRKNVLFNWTNECQKNFETLKKMLTVAPILWHLDSKKDFKLYADCSSVGIGCMLVQTFNDGEHVIAYSSRILLESEQKYSTTDRELLALQ